MHIYTHTCVNAHTHAYMNLQMHVSGKGGSIEKKYMYYIPGQRKTQGDGERREVTQAVDLPPYAQTEGSVHHGA